MVIIYNPILDSYTKLSTDWEEDWGYTFFFKYALTVDELQRETMLTSVMPAETQIMTSTDTLEYSLTTNYDSFTVTDGINNATVVDGEVIDGDLAITCYGPQNEVDAELSMLLICPRSMRGRVTSLRLLMKTATIPIRQFFPVMILPMVSLLLYVQATPEASR